MSLQILHSPEMRPVLQIVAAQLCLGLVVVGYLVTADLLAHGLTRRPDLGSLLDALDIPVLAWAYGVLPVLLGAWFLTGPGGWRVIGVILGSGCALIGAWVTTLPVTLRFAGDTVPATTGSLAAVLLWVVVLVLGQAIVTLTVAQFVVAHGPGLPDLALSRGLRSHWTVPIVVGAVVVLGAVALAVVRSTDTRSQRVPPHQHFHDRVADEQRGVQAPPPGAPVPQPPPAAPTTPTLTLGMISLTEQQVRPRALPAPLANQSIEGAVISFTLDACWLLNTGTAHQPTGVPALSTAGIPGHVSGLAGRSDRHLDPRRGAYRSLGWSGDQRRPDAVMVEVLAPTRNGQVTEWVRVGGVVVWRDGEWQISTRGLTPTPPPQQPDLVLTDMTRHDRALLLADEPGWTTFA